MKSNSAKMLSKKKSSGGVFETLKTIIYAILIALIVRTVAFEPFNIPSGSMIPTLLVGDYLFVSKFSYGYSRFSLPFGLPLFSGRIFAFGQPRRGEVAVFKLPTDTSTDYIKRIVGLPGDKIQMIHGNLVINGQTVPRRQIDDCIYQESGATTILLHQYIETLPRGPGEPGLDHRIIKIGDDGMLDNTAVFEVPPGHYFAMGDNRDNSQDSRTLQVGFIPAENLVGPAEFLFFSTDGSANWWEVWKWPFAIRYSRLFHGVQGEGPSRANAGTVRCE